MPTLGVNIDHVATVRQARRTTEPDTVPAAAAAVRGGADQITIHLREDRRHIQDHDLDRLAESVTVRLNLECAVVDEMLEIALRTRPHQVCLVPEKREEVTTEGGLDLIAHRDRVADAVSRLNEAGILASLFIDPDPDQIEIAHQIDAGAVELHTGAYANATGQHREDQLRKLAESAVRVRQAKMHLHAGHGLNYENVIPVATIEGMEELNIGHSIVARSIFVGLETAVREMKQLMI